MRANHRPRAERLRARIYNLEIKLANPTSPMGGGNPYWKCNGCGQTDPQVSIEGHRKGCPLEGYRAEIRHYKKLLAEEVQKCV